MVRRHDWASRLFAVADEHQDRSFAWGVNDCCLFVARCIDAMTDSDLEAQILSRYSDVDSARAFVLEYGLLSVAVSHYLGEPVTRSPQRGDAVLIHGGEDYAVGICLGSQIAAMGPTGLRMLPLSEVIKVWPV